MMDENTPAIGIDLGYNNTVMAYYKPQTQSEPGNAIILQNNGENTTPSLVSFTDDGELVGIPAKYHCFTDPKNTIFYVKRLIGRNFDDQTVQALMKSIPYKIVCDQNNKPCVEINLNDSIIRLSPEKILSKILLQMKTVAQEYFSKPIENAVITIPAYFNDSQKQATKDAAEMADLKVLDILSEPVAAALAFKLKNSDNSKKNVLVYDLGCSTFDVTVLVIEGKNIIVKTYNGDNIGGDDFDANLFEHCHNEFDKIYRIRIDNKTKEGLEAIYRLKIECEKAKQILSVQQTAVIIIEKFYHNRDLKIDITRKSFEQINQNLFERTKTLLNDTLGKAGMTCNDIDDLVLVGGSTKIPKVRQLLTDLFANKQIHFTDNSVSLGACVHAAILTGIKT